MENGHLKIITVLIVLGISLGLLLGLQKLYKNNFIDEPIKNALEQLSFAQSVKVSIDNGIYDYRVQIRQAGNIQYEYEKIDSIIANNLKGKEYQLTLVDHRNPKLKEDLEGLELSIYEAMAKNNYLWLDEAFRQAADQNKFSYRLFIDDRRLYIQLADQENFLYEIIERSTPLNRGLNEGE